MARKCPRIPLGNCINDAALAVPPPRAFAYVNLPEIVTHSLASVSRRASAYRRNDVAETRVAVLPVIFKDRGENDDDTHPLEIPRASVYAYAKVVC